MQPDGRGFESRGGGSIPEATGGGEGPNLLLLLSRALVAVYGITLLFFLCFSSISSSLMIFCRSHLVAVIWQRKLVHNVV